jgi:hypothetical protein
MSALPTRKSERGRVADRLATAETKLTAARGRFDTADQAWQTAVLDGDASRQAADRVLALRAVDEAQAEVDVLTARLAEIDAAAAVEQQRRDFDEAAAQHAEKASQTRAAREKARQTILAARPQLLELAAKIRGAVENLQQAQLAESDAAAHATSTAETVGEHFDPPAVDAVEQLAVELADPNDRSAMWLLSAGRRGVAAVLESFSAVGQQHRVAVSGQAVEIVNIARPTPGTHPGDAGFGIDYAALNRPA